MHKTNFPLPRMIIVAVILLSFGTILGITAYSLSFKKNPIAIEPAPKTEPSPIPESEIIPEKIPVSDIDISDWKTYRNEKAGFEVKYPNKWGPVENEEFRRSIAGKGEEFYAIFTDKNFSVSGNTKDFEAYENPFPVYLGGDPLIFCNKFEKQVFSSEGCKEISRNMTSISYGFHFETGMFGSGNEIIIRKVAFINNATNKYSGITIWYALPAYQDDHLVDMNEDQIQDIAQIQLSKIDKETENIFDQILSTLKFIEN